MGDFSVKAVLSAVDKNFSSTMKSALGYTNNLKSTLTSGIGFGAMMAIGQNAVSVVTNKMSGLSKETIETSDSMQKLQAAMRFSGYAEGEIQRIAGATGSLKTYADKTVFSLQDVMSTFGALSANGIKDADKLTEAVGNAVAVFGGGAQEYSSVALAFSQAMAAGSLHAQDWNQILNASPQLAGGLRKELIRLNPVLGKDFKGAMEDGAITADLLAEAMNNIGMTDMAKEAATSVTTFEGAMGNLEATAVSGMMKLYDTFAKSSVIDAINSLNEKVGAGFDWLSTAIPTAIDKISPYWQVFKSDFTEVKNAFGDAVNAIASDVGELTGAFGSTESVDNFSNVLGTATDALKTFAGFCEVHSETIAKVITILPKLYAAYKGFKIVKAVAPFVGAFTGAVGGLVKLGLSKLAPNLFNVAKGQEAVGKSSGGSSKKMLASAKAFVMLGAGVLAISAGFYLLAQSAVAVANAGPLAVGVLVGLVGTVTALSAGMMKMMSTMSGGTKKIAAVSTAMLALGASILLISAGFWILSDAAVRLADAGPLAVGAMAGMVVAIGALLLVAKAVAPALSAGAVGFVAFGAAVVLAGAGMMLMTNAAIALANAGPLAIGVMEGMVAAIALLAAGAAFLGPMLTAGAVGLIAFGVAIVLVATGALIASAALAVVAAVLPTITEYGLSGAAAIVSLGAALAVFAAGTALAGVGCAALGIGLVAVAAGLAAVGIAVGVVAVGVLALAAGVLVLGAGLMIVSSSALVLAAALPLMAVGALANVAAFAALLAISVALSASMLLLLASLTATGAVILIASAGVAAFGLAMTAGAVGVAAMALALKAVNSSMKSISSNAKTAASSLKSMRTSVSVVNDGLDAIGSKAKSAMKSLTGAFDNAADKAASSGQKVGNNFNAGLNAGTSKAISAARSASNSVVTALRAAGNGAYSSGAYIGQGLANGMRSQLGNVRSIAAQLAAAANEAIVAKARIGSPSKITTQFGKWYGEGWVNGISSMIKDSMAVAKELVEIPELDIPNPRLAFAGGYNNANLSDDYDYYSNANYTIVVPLSVDGREFARATATYTQEELDSREKFKNYRKGYR